MVNVKIQSGSGALTDMECPNLCRGKSIQEALGGAPLTYVYYVEMDDNETVVAAVSPVSSAGSTPPILVMHPEDRTTPLFTLYLALQNGDPIDLTEELFDRAKSMREDMMYDDVAAWTGTGATTDPEAILKHILPLMGISDEE